MKRKLLFEFAAAIAAATLLAGCSLLKVSVSTGEPLPDADMRLRTMTRGFYYDFSDEVARAADSVAATAPEPAVRMAAVRWKIRATRAGVEAAMQGNPEVSLADLWILCRRMNEDFARMPDSLLFGPQSDIARAAAARLDSAAGRLARQMLDAGRYALMERFVGEYVRENPGSDVRASNTTLRWIEYLRANGIEFDNATGTIAEVLSDVNDRLSGQTQQISNSLGWTKEILEMRLRQDSLHLEVRAQLDSLERNFKRLVVVAEHVPQITDKMLEDLRAQATLLIGAMNASVDNLFGNFDRQRMELESYVTRERRDLVEQLRASASEVTQQALDAVPGLIGRVLLYVVLALVVLIGGPFALGFWLGGIRQKGRIHRS